MVVTRFAPSPTGPLHLGHAYAAIVAHDMARAAGGRFLLRMEDIDRQRSRGGWDQACLDDLAWLGLTWDGLLYQSTRLPAYQAALDRLEAMGLLYGCTCTRGDIKAALSAPQGGILPSEGPDGLVYPGTCRGKPVTSGALRLDLTRAVNRAPHLEFTETGTRPGLHRIDPLQMLSEVGDVVLARRDMGTSYHLSVVVDDAFQGVTHVTRGEDLFEATQIHVLLQRLMGLSSPIWHHHALIRDDEGRRLAKRDDARALMTYRAEGATPADIRRMVGLG
ncbi:tRNA glutamyl-Q(34) synthetase GluQRS [Stagnihabitans tardus]|uniref:tRNA glutamyl-Q(34) synthetase GluQRS n=1 Tax=Stagnihabitans tardus TaxID=2699202 RepID=A0AAE5BV60_9RHOB|nr:tRNA glutamyl-Q(34) synthetase GluQRS [Stagnihabitans tardus]NBZ87967.1 tRNA glutamyl-Q(34) synthetase GluQRS [Stagnihabitans tardus]